MLKQKLSEEIKVTFDSSTLIKLQNIISGTCELSENDFQFLKEMECDAEAQDDKVLVEKIQKRLAISDSQFLKRADYHSNFCDTRE